MLFRKMSRRLRWTSLTKDVDLGAAISTGKNQEIQRGERQIRVEYISAPDVIEVAFLLSAMAP